MRCNYFANAKCKIQNVKLTSFRLRSTYKEYINKKYLTTFGKKYTHVVGARNTLQARNTNISVCVKVKNIPR